MPAAANPASPLPLSHAAPLHVAGPAVVTVVQGGAWTWGWHLREGDTLTVPPGAVAALEPPPLRPDDVPRAADSAAGSVRVEPADACDVGGRRPPPPLPPAWRAAAASFADAVAAAAAAGSLPPCVAVVGPKSAGKSALARLLVNEALSAAAATGTPASPHPRAVAWLDGDAGQPEFTPPGLVSGHILASPIVGPPPSHPRPAPDIAYFVGAPSPGPCPRRYAACAGELARWYTATAASRVAAAVVNTHGWVRGAGLAATGGLLADVAPSHVVTLVTPRHRRNAPPAPWWESGGAPAAVAELPALEGGGGGGGDGDDDDPAAAPSSSSSSSTIDQRVAVWLPFARAAAGAAPAACAPTAAALADTAAALASAPPRLAPLDALPLAFVGGGVEPPPTGQEMRAINCGVVALATARETPGGRPAPVLGLAIVRAVDAGRGPSGTLHVLTGVEQSALPGVAALQAGALELPPAFLVGGEGVAASPYLAQWCLTGAGGTGARAARARNDLARGGGR